MDANKFLKEQSRLCRSYADCIACPLNGNLCVDITDDSSINKKITIVEKWAKEHPVKTRMAEFMNVFPDIRLEDGAPICCPKNIDKNLGSICQLYPTCLECRKKYWLEEIE